MDHPCCVELGSKRPHVQHTATLIDLPPHVWALVLRDASVHAIFTLAHVCRALHELIASTATCTCATVAETPSDEASARSRAFWAHWGDVHPPPSLDEWKAHVRCGHVAHIAVALRCGADPSSNYQWPVLKASEYGHLAIVTLLLRDARVDPSAFTQYAIRMASENGHVAVVERLLRDARVNPNADEQRAFRSASREGHVKVVDCLLRDPRVDPGARDQDAIQWASVHGNVEVVERLLRDARVDPSANDQLAIRWACRCRNVAVVERLLRDERVARDVATLHKCITQARAAGQDDIVTLLERPCAALGANAVV